MYIILNKAASLKRPTEPEDNVDYEAKLETENELIKYIFHASSLYHKGYSKMFFADQS